VGLTEREREEADGGAWPLCGLWVNGQRGSVGGPSLLRKENGFWILLYPFPITQKRKINQEK
jgi:hypothetical protein